MLIMNRLKKFFASVMALVMVAPLGLMTGCGNKAQLKGIKTVAADSTWYESTTIALGEQYRSNEYSFVNMDTLGVVDDRILVYASGMRVVPANVDWDTYNYIDYSVEDICFYSKSGDLLNTINLWDGIREMSPDVSGAYVKRIRIIDGNIRLTVNLASTDASTWGDFTGKDYYIFFDGDTGAMLNSEEVPETSFSETNGYYQENVFNLAGGYMVTTYHSTSSTYGLDITTPDGRIEPIAMGELFSFYEMYDIPAITSISDTEAIFRVTLNDRSYVWFQLDLNSMTVSEYAGDVGIFEGINLSASNYVDGVGLTAISNDQVVVIDAVNGTSTPFFSFEETNVNRFITKELSLGSVSADGSELVFAGNVKYSNTGVWYELVPHIVVLNKCDTNPNAGKIILDTAYLSDLTNAICESVCRFNDSNDDYFVLLSDRYSIDNLTADGLISDEDRRAAMTELSNQLAIDLMAGDGPDIILNAFEYSQINNSDYLLDLSSSINTDGLFSNVINAARTGDALYQVPLGFGVNGIAMKQYDRLDNQSGFTLEQYAEFVSNECNGTDPVSLNQANYFISVIGGMIDICRDGDGAYNFDNEIFREFAAYIKENVSDENSESSESRSLSNPQKFLAESFADIYCSFNNIEQFRMMGIPSVDGRGPSAHVSYSVGVSSICGSPEGGIAFAQFLLGEEVQEYLAVDAFPISVAAADSILDRIVEEQNRLYDLYHNVYGETDIELSQYGIHHMNGSLTDYFDSMLMSISSCDNSTESVVLTILYEEIQAYFADQKTIDETIGIVSDRVRTYTNERG